MSSLPLTFRAPAKINLYLHVAARRDDGYHTLDSLVVFTDDCADILTLNPAPALTVSFSGAFADGLNPRDNLVTKAAALYSMQTGKDLPFHIHVEKNIPVGAGLGGGSSDAAATIKGLEQFYNRPLPDPSALVTLGADVPVCYFGKAAKMQGIGEILSPVTLPPLILLLIWPNIHAVTKDAFQNRKNIFSNPLKLPFSFENTRNDLVDSALALYPAIKDKMDFLKTQKGCTIVRMSGSGSCVFGVFDTLQNAQAAAATVPHDWWSKMVRI